MGDGRRSVRGDPVVLRPVLAGTRLLTSTPAADHRFPRDQPNSLYLPLTKPNSNNHGKKKPEGIPATGDHKSVL